MCGEGCEGCGCEFWEVENGDDIVEEDDEDWMIWV